MSYWKILTDIDEAPRAAGVYVYYLPTAEGWKLQYIGSTGNLKRRLYEHKHQKLDPDTCGRLVTVKIKVARKYGEQLLWEARLIRRCKLRGVQLLRHYLAPGQPRTPRIAPRTQKYLDRARFTAKIVELGGQDKLLQLARTTRSELEYVEMLPLVLKELVIRKQIQISEQSTEPC